MRYYVFGAMLIVALSPYGKSALDGAFGENAFGHTGYTGTSVYVYPEKNVIAVHLTNRVHPTRANTKQIQLRKVVHKAISNAIWIENKNGVKCN